MVALIGILGAIAVPSYHKMLSRARAARILGDFEAVRTAAYQYQAKSGRWPRDVYPGEIPVELEPHIGAVAFAGKGYRLDYENWSYLIGISVLVDDPRLEAAVAKAALQNSLLGYRSNHRYTLLIESKVSGR